MTSLATETRECIVTPRREIEPGAWLSVFQFQHDFPGFAGHFPGSPVLPGIVQMLAAIHTAGEYTLYKIKNCKFFLPVRPDEELFVRVRLAHGGEEVIAQAELSVNKGTCSTMTLHLKPA
jgi:3-hydroxymyristoyl/3-hydroxydecanoyl-(acyl carrier protein) dehydratase